MCQKVTCRTCGKATWSGCGLHIEDALRGVPAGQRCSCSAGAAPGATEGRSKSSGLFSRLLGR